MADYTDLKSDNPFYGGIAPTWGVGLHEDVDTTVNPPLVEVIKADYINRIENRIDRLENIFNQMEHELLYPSGAINEDDIEDELISEDVPASGEYYLTSRLDILASGLNTLIELLIDNSTIDASDVVYYPYYVGEIVET